MQRGKRNQQVETVFSAKLGTVVVILGASLAVVPQSEAESTGPAFTESSEFGNGPTIPVSWGDYDADGDLNLAVGNFGGSNELYVNNGNGTFTGGPRFGGGPRSQPYGVIPTTTVTSIWR